MAKKPINIVQEKKERFVYTLFYFFVTSFLLKSVFGIMAGSRCMLITGIFALFGIFATVAMLVRIGQTPSTRPRRMHFNQGKLESILIFGMSVMIALSTASFLLSIVHMMFFHTLYPPELSAAWIATIVAVLNLSLSAWIARKNPGFPLTDFREIMFALNMDFLLSILTMITVVIARMGAPILDFICAMLTAFFILIYSISFLYDAFKGLMDASCDKKTVALIAGYIRKAKIEGTLETLRVNKIGQVFEIIAILKVQNQTAISDVTDIIKNIKNQIKDKFLQPHEVFVSITSGGEDEKSVSVLQ
jgi:divalent metal cation (Fe/Co/Zn/Cd) transporter